MTPSGTSERLSRSNARPGTMLPAYPHYQTHPKTLKRLSNQPNKPEIFPLILNVGSLRLSKMVAGYEMAEAGAKFFNGFSVVRIRQ